jgi:S1-C subfamily serine protease
MHTPSRLAIPQQLIAGALALVPIALLATLPVVMYGSAYALTPPSSTTPTATAALGTSPSNTGTTPLPTTTDTTPPAPGNGQGNGSQTPPTTDAPASPPPTPKMLNDAKKSVVGLILTWSVDVTIITSTGPITRTVFDQGECTGFYVGQSTGINNGYIATGGHCVDPNEVKASLQAKVDNIVNPPTGPKGGPPANTPQPNKPVISDPRLRAQVIHLDDTDTNPVKPIDAHQMPGIITFDQGDFGLLKVDGLTYTPSILLATAEPTLGDNLVSIGLVGSMLEDAIQADQPQTTSPLDDPYARNPGQYAKDVSVSRARLSFEFGQFSGEQYPLGFGARFLQTSAPLTPGMSGGPTVKVENGKLVVAGTNSYSRDLQPFNFFTDTSGLNNFLNDHGVTTGQTAGSAPSAQSGDKSSSPTNDTATPNTNPAMAQTGSSTVGLQGNTQNYFTALWLNIILGFIALCFAAALILIFLWMRRQNNPPAIQPNDSLHDDAATQHHSDAIAEQPADEDRTTPVDTVSERPTHNQ